MKTIRTILATLSVELLTFALVAWFSVRRDAAFLQRTIYQGFDQTFVVALVMGSAFLLIAVILTVAIVSIDDDDADEEEEEEELPRPKPRPRSKPASQRQPEEERYIRSEKKPSAQKGEPPYRRVSRERTMEPGRSSKREEDGGFARPKERPVHRKERAAEHPEEVALFRRHEAAVKQPRKVPRPLPAEDEFVEVPEPEEAAPTPVEAVEPAEATPTPMEAAEPAEASEPAETAEPEKEAAAPEEEAAAPEEEASAPEEEAEAPEEEAEPEREAEEPEEETAEPEPTAEGTGEEAPEEASGDDEKTPDAAPLPDAAEEPPTPEPTVRLPVGEGTVRCVFCGNTIGRNCLFCPYCGKKR